MPNKTWTDYYKVKQSKPPSKLMIKALEYVSGGNKALDLGAGALVDTKYLLEKGFEVTAVDKSPGSLTLAQEIQNPHFSFITSSYDTFNFPRDTYDFINAQWALPFNSPKTFVEMFEKLKKSLNQNGVFVGQFFGILDEWNIPEKDMTFLTYEEVQELLSNMNIISLQEEEKEGTTALGVPKHWHIFHVIAQKD